MSEVPPYVRLPEPVAVTVAGPRGRFAGSVEGYAGDRVYCRWGEGPGETYLGWLPASQVERVDKSRR